MSELRVVSDWPATAHAKGREAALIYAPPCCGEGTSCEINVQTPAPGEPVETQLWCHAHMRGADATVTAV